MNQISRDTSKKYLCIVEHLEGCLRKYGDSYRGVDYPKKEYVEKDHRVMLELIRETQKVSLLDFGCGCAHLYEFILQNNINNIEYNGLDISKQFYELSKKKYPDKTFYCLDINDGPVPLPVFDYIVMSGIFTEKCALTYEEMLTYFKQTLINIFPFAGKGIAFNVMSKHVDWERDDLFHLPLDVLADFLTKNLTRNYIIRNDYGRYAYTVYVYR